VTVDQGCDVRARHRLRGALIVTITPEVREDLLRAIPSLRAFAISLCGDVDRADDLAQEAITRAITRIDLFEPGTNVEAWLFTILRNHFYSEHRKRRREVQDPEGAYAATLATLPDQEERVAHKDFLAALQKLPPDQREALLLVGAQGLSYEEAAQIMDVAEGTIKSRVHRARANLSRVLNYTGIEDLGTDRVMRAAMREAL
jgi:RNA polymerase sigma-70 factor (ECF subfamily)